MLFYRKLYASASVQDKKRRICRNLKYGKGQLNIYVVSLSESQDIFDIFHCALLKQRIIKRRGLRVMGIASGYAEAIELAARMVDDFYHKYGTAFFKNIILEEERDNFKK